MAFTLLNVDPMGDAIIATGASIKERVLVLYDTIGDETFDMDRDEVLQIRSALELVRDRLSEEQIEHLDQIDAYWRDNAEVFNASFATMHNQAPKDTALRHFVVDGEGNVPAVPRSHWWWRAIERAEA